MTIHLDLMGCHPFPWMMLAGRIRWHEPADVDRAAVRYPVQSWSCAMDAISYTAARANLAQTMKRVCADHEPMIITR
ncbi:MAG: type II toxin-antitoxin system Phd/YefM family antitoxin, partial [Cyanobium sp.]